MRVKCLYLIQWGGSNPLPARKSFRFHFLSILQGSGRKNHKIFFT